MSKNWIKPVKEKLSLFSELQIVRIKTEEPKDIAKTKFCLNTSDKVKYNANQRSKLVCV